MSTSTYPVHVGAHLDPELSRGLWLVKWVLVVPHYVVLAFLWLAFAVLSVAAFFAILFTGRYPRAIFEFNVGVLRWTWRVSYYAYGALGTDRYPPFSLKDDPTYPARLDVDYPRRLSRGLVLVKWWLLALPHYLIVGVLIGSGAYAVAQSSDVARTPLVWGGGLIGLLVLIAAVVLLFTGRYPRPLFDLILGLNRWVLRVAGYAALMTDEYPPFRLDHGDDDRGSSEQLALPLTPATNLSAGHAPASADPWTAGRVTALVVGAAGLIVSVGLAGAGGVLAYADTAMRDSGGYVMSDSVRLSTQTYALTSANVELHAADVFRTIPADAIGDVKITVTAGSQEPVFVGIAPTRTVQSYLHGVARAQLRSLSGDAAAYTTLSGTAPTRPPGEALSWAAQSAGTGTHSLVWPVEAGDWTVVVMNADRSAGVDAAIAYGATVPALRWLVPLLLALGATGLLVAIALLVGAVAMAARSKEASHRP
jgi:hypothetical protein